MTRGRVHWYTKGTGHGFIKPDDGSPMAFVRREDLVAGEEEDLENNDQVYFEVIRDGVIVGDAKTKRAVLRNSATTLSSFRGPWPLPIVSLPEVAP